MKKKIETLIKNKPSKDAIFDSIEISDDFWRLDYEQQKNLSEKQQKERVKEKVNYELKVLPFSI